MIDPILAGVLSNAISELIFGRIRALTSNKKSLQEKISKVYNDSLNETEKKFKGSGEELNRLFKNIRIKRKFFSLSGGKVSVLEYIKTYAKETKRRKDNELEIEGAIENFYQVFISKLKEDQQLYNLILEAYLGDILKLQSSIKEKTDLIPEIKNKTDAIFEHVKERSTVISLGKSNFPFHIGAFQLNIYGSNVKTIVNALSSTYDIIQNEKIQNRTIIEISNKNETWNSLRIIFNGEPFRIIYPPEDKTVIWIDEVPNKIVFTCFAANFHKKREIETEILNYLGTGIIKEITLDTKIVSLFKKYINNTTHLKYNPRISTTLKIKNITHKIEGKIGIFGGDAGFLKHDSIKPIIDKFVEGSKGKHADIFFFKVMSVQEIYSNLSDFDFHRDGRVIGHIPRKNINYYEVRKSLYNFLIENGGEFS